MVTVLFQPLTHLFGRGGVRTGVTDEYVAKAASRDCDIAFIRYNATGTVEGNWNMLVWSGFGRGRPAL